MPTTSNFGWTTPADTDLVKDGAAAIRTLGNGIDTSLVDLKGGTTGQILSKASNSDLDYTWINNDQGDITAVTAGTGLSGGGTTGAVTVSLEIPVTATNGGTAQTTYATGDMLFASAANTLSKRAIGTTGQVLTVSGGVPTWATASSGSLTQLASGSLSGAGVTISSISGSYTHLQLWLYEFSENSSGWFGLRFNSDSGNNYYFAQADSQGLPSTGTADTKIGIQTAGNTAADVKGTNVLDIYFYAQTGRKLVRGNFFGQRSGGDLRTGLIGGAWDSTAAITSLTVLPEPTNTFDAGSYVLYGVK